MRADNLKRHQSAGLCGKYTARSSEYPFSRCGKHTKSNLSQHITKHHPEIPHLSLEKIFEVAQCTDLLADAKLHMKTPPRPLLF